MLTDNHRWKRTSKDREEELCFCTLYVMKSINRRIDPSRCLNEDHTTIVCCTLSSDRYSNSSKTTLPQLIRACVHPLSVSWSSPIQRRKKSFCYLYLQTRSLAAPPISILTVVRLAVLKSSDRRTRAIREGVKRCEFKSFSESAAGGNASSHYPLLFLKK